MVRNFKLYFWFAIFPLMMGLALYLSFGSTSTRIFGIFDKLIGRSLLAQMRPDIHLPSFVMYHLADGIWAFALTSTLCLLLHKEMHLKLLLVISILASFLFEMGQYFNWVKGTSDIIDMCFMLFFSLLAFFLINKKLLLCKSS